MKAKKMKPLMRFAVTCQSVPSLRTAWAFLKKELTHYEFRNHRAEAWGLGRVVLQDIMPYYSPPFRKGICISVVLPRSMESDHADRYDGVIEFTGDMEELKAFVSKADSCHS